MGHQLVLLCLLGAVFCLTSASDEDACKQSKDAGTCSGNLWKWYYHAGMEDYDCERFEWTGCGGNDNRFDSRAECESTCFPDEEAVTSTPTSTVTTRAARCNFPKEHGYCNEDSVRRYYYDQSIDKCVAFDWSGCGGNANKFVSQLLCIALCEGFNN